MTTNARFITELFTTTPNEPGVLAKLTMPLQEKGINIEALHAYEKDATTSVVRFVSSDNVKAKEWLTENGYTVTENPVVCWNATNNPGMLYRASAVLAEKRINISYTYGSGGAGNTTGFIIFNTDNNEETVNTLNTI